jgi:hypothetical protein
MQKRDIAKRLEFQKLRFAQPLLRDRPHEGAVAGCKRRAGGADL